jgi:plasmid stabilization system protein ParE
MDYKIIITEDAEADLERFIFYLLFVKKSQQAAANVLDDFEQTKNELSRVAGSLKDCENPQLQKYGYKRINFLHHRYFMLYRIEEDTAIVDNIFHDLQDYEHMLT